MVEEVVLICAGIHSCYGFTASQIWILYLEEIGLILVVSMSMRFVLGCTCAGLHACEVKLSVGAGSWGS